MKFRLLLIGLFFITVDGYCVNSNEPKKVYVNYAINQIIGIDYVNQTFQIDFYFQQYWKVDSTLLVQMLSKEQLNGGSTIFIDDLEWCPQNDFTNVISIETIGELTYSFLNGYILLDARYSGTFYHKMDLTDFPFDQQDLVIQLEDFSKPTNTLLYQYGSPFDSPLEDKDTVLIPSQKAFETDVDFSEFHLNPIVKAIRGEHIYEFTNENQAYSHLNFVLNVSRKKGFYLTKVISVSLLIVLMSWIVFFMGPTDLANRSAFSITVFLALTAHNFIVNSLLPMISYLTTIDYIMFGTNILVFFTVIESFIVARISSNVSVVKAKKIDRYSFFACLISFSILCIFILLKSISNV